MLILNKGMESNESEKSNSRDNLSCKDGFLSNKTSFSSDSNQFSITTGNSRKFNLSNENNFCSKSEKVTEQTWQPSESLGSLQTNKTYKSIVTVNTENILENAQNCVDFDPLQNDKAEILKKPNNENITGLSQRKNRTAKFAEDKNEFYLMKDDKLKQVDEETMKNQKPVKISFDKVEEVAEEYHEEESNCFIKLFCCK